MKTELLTPRSTRRCFQPALRRWAIGTLAFCVLFLVGQRPGAVAATPAETAGNEVVNTGFDTEEGNWGLFVPKESADKHCQFVISQDAPHTGTGCAKLSSSDFARYSVSPKEPVVIAPGERWRVTAWLRVAPGTQAKKGTPGFLMRFPLLKDKKEVPGAYCIFVGLNGKPSLQSQGDELDFSDFGTALPTAWTKIEAVFEIPRTLGDINGMYGPALFSWSTKGTIYIDDVSLGKVSPETPLSPTIPLNHNREGSVTTDDEALASLNLDAAGMTRVKAAVQAGDREAAKQAYLDYRRNACPARWTVNPKDRPAKPVAASDPAGDEVCNHYLRNHYGFEPRAGDMGKDFNWAYNPVPLGNPAYTDEWTFCVVSRTQFWETLAGAYWSTGNEKYAREWVAELEDFIRKNPMDAKASKAKPSLWRTLDASERMDESWPDAYFHFLDSTAFTPQAQWDFLKSVCDHGKLLEKGLKTPGRTGNWVASEGYGLYTMGVLFPELKEAPAWRELALDRLTEELNRMVPPDGFEAELTPTYHYFSLSSFVGPLRLAQINQLAVPESFHTKILAMYRAPILVMDQEGNVVPTNDSAPMSAVAKAREGLRFLGDDPLLKWAASKGLEGTAPPPSDVLPNAGFYAMRGGWRPNDVFLFFRGGPAGIQHEHEDMLEVVLRAWNKTLLLDPGSATYDHSDWRRFIIGTASHNTIVVDGKWQHRGHNELPVPAVNNPWMTTPLFDYAAATYDKGYQQSVYDATRAFSPQQWKGEVDHSVSHTRRVLFLKPYYALVLDTLDGTGNHTFDAHFHVVDSTARLDASSQAVFSQGENAPHLAIYPLETDHLTTEIVQGQKDPLLGWMTQQKAIPTIRFRKQQDAPAVFASFLYPFATDPPAFSTQILAVEGGNTWARSLHTSREDAELIIARNSAPDKIRFKSHWLMDVACDAAVVVVRKPAEGRRILQSAGALTSWTDKAWSFASDKGASLTWMEDVERLTVFNADEQPHVLTISKPFQLTANLPPGQWAEIAKAGAKVATAPELFAPLPPRSPVGVTYANYCNAPRGSAVPASAGGSIRIAAATMTLPPGAVVKPKTDAERAVTGWDQMDAVLSTRVSIPAPGWYRLKIRYCTPGEPTRSVLLNGSVPFAEAGGFALPATEGLPPSDGWSGTSNDWKETFIGESSQPGGWKFFLPSGSTELSLRNDGGGGSNVDWVELVPASDSPR